MGGSLMSERELAGMVIHGEDGVRGVPSKMGGGHLKLYPDGVCGWDTTKYIRTQSEYKPTYVSTP